MTGEQLESRRTPGRPRSLRPAVRTPEWVFLAVIGILLPVSSPPLAQVVPDLTVEAIYGAKAFAAESVSAGWMPDGVHWTVVEADGEGRDELWRIHAETGERVKLISAAELAGEDASRALAIDDYELTSDGRRALLFTNAQRVWRQKTKGEYWIFDFASRRLTPVSRNPGWQMFAKFSPDGNLVAFARDHDLYVTDLDSGRERRLTFDGSGTILNGTTDWVYEEELDLRDAFRWSPDGQRIAYWRFDQGPVREFPLVDESSAYPEITWLRYPKAGERNSLVRVGALELATGRTTWFDVGPETDDYVPRMEWAGLPGAVVIQRINRRQNRLDLLLGDAATGETTLLFSEEDDAWVDACDDVQWIEGGERFTWTSERDGWRHLYLYARSGRLVRQLTRGPWDVTEFHGVDEATGRAYFSAASESPLTRTVHSVSLEGTDLRVLAGGRGTHAARFSPDYRQFIDMHSTVGSPPAFVLRRVEDLALLRVLEDNRQLHDRLDGLDLREPEFFTVQAADGTPLNGWIIKPRDFDPRRAYPLLIYVYGGPGSQTVRDEWGGSRYLWHQMMVRRGILVASVDNRGTGARGRQFTKQVYLRLGQLESADQLAAIWHLAEQPYVDASRIGIWGWSYGGYLSLMTTLQGEGTIAAAVAGAPVTAWELYDTIYTERYMRTPSENADGYRRGSPLQLASRLQSALLLVHGTADDNVHAQNTTQMVQALEEAGKHFEMRLYPGRWHGFEGEDTQVNLWQLVADFLADQLAGAQQGAAPLGLAAP